MNPNWLLVAQDARLRVFEWGRIQSNVDWLPPLAALAVLLVLVVWLYRRDAIELGRPLRWTLTALRAGALLGLLIIYLQPQWRTEREVTENSRVLLLVDTSLSMGLPASDYTESPGGGSRADEVVEAVERRGLLDALSERHDVVVQRFDIDLARVATLPKMPAGGAAESAADRATAAATDANAAAPATDASGRAASSASFAATDSSDGTTEAVDAAATGDAAQATGVMGGRGAALDWSRLLEPRGSETHLGEALRQALFDERAGPVAGVVLVTDGGQNAGVGPEAAMQMAAESRIPILPIGLGPERQPVNVRVSDLMAPARAYPGDTYTVTGYLQAQGLAAQEVTVELLSRPADAGPDAAAGSEREGSQQVTLGADGEVLPIRFELTPRDVGRRTLQFRVVAPAADSNPTDNQQEVDVDVVDRKLEVLLIAGGPTREYQFVRNLLHRDRGIVVDVYLQTSRPGMSQDARQILPGLPSTPEDLFRYDAIIAFDPDWRALGADNVALLERWVAQQAGGMILVAGPIYTSDLAADDGLRVVRNLYPVEFQRRFSSLAGEAAVTAREAWPIEFTREGLDAEFLWLDDSGPASQAAWNRFPGVFAHATVRGPKPGATVYGHYGDPRARVGEGPPVYLAGQFYGSGRTFYLGSGELWRLRGVDEGHFERLYTQLVRHVAQGRLLRGSSRGILMTERDRYTLGESVAVRAQLTTPRLDPLELDSVPLEILLPDGSVQTVSLLPDPTLRGGYRGQFTVRQEGAFRLELVVPESDEERLSRRIQVRVPDLERDRPQRNDVLLSEMARATGGTYYVGFAPALDPNNPDRLTEQLKDRSRTLVLSDAPQTLWDNGWMLALVCGCLCLEWLVRRLSKLA